MCPVGCGVCMEACQPSGKSGTRVQDVSSSAEAAPLALGNCQGVCAYARHIGSFRGRVFAHEACMLHIRHAGLSTFFANSVFDGGVIQFLPACFNGRVRLFPLCLVWRQGLQA